MKVNVGNLDRVIRIVLAAVVGLLYATGQIHGTTALILGVLAVIFLVTGAVGLCPLYHLLKLSTAKK